jgi:hypothetical protein
MILVLISVYICMSMCVCLFQYVFKEENNCNLDPLGILGVHALTMENLCTFFEETIYIYSTISVYVYSLSPALLLILLVMLLVVLWCC